MADPAATVYSYYTPEIEHTVSKALSACNFSRYGEQTIHDTLKQNYDPGLDDLHLPLMEKYEAFARSEGVIGLESFAEKYFTNGSSEGIFHLLSQLRTLSDLGVPLYQFDGEYQGYRAYADALDLKIDTVQSLGELRSVATGVVILSNPASKDGNIVDPNTLTTILRKHEVILDLAYMGMTQKPLNIDATQPGIIAAVGSLSKPFGLYYYRIGFCYSREPVSSLYGNKWFKNALSIKIGEAVLDQAEPKKLVAFKDKYFELQRQAVMHTANHFGAPNGWIKPSDVWLLAHSKTPTGFWSEVPIHSFKRTDEDLRFCLTPYYMEQQNG